jgi:ribosomal protein L40E
VRKKYYEDGTKMKLCKKCGEKLEKDAGFCSKCGAKQVSDAPKTADDKALDSCSYIDDDDENDVPETGNDDENTLLSDSVFGASVFEAKDAWASMMGTVMGRILAGTKESQVSIGTLNHKRF